MKIIHLYTFTYLAIGISLFLLPACQEKPPNESAAPAAAAVVRTPTVEVVHPVPRSFEAETEITGTTRANRTVKLRAMESGYLRTMRKDIGDFVKKDEAVAILENPDLTNQIERLQVAVETTKRTFERLQGIQEKTPALITLQQVEDAEAAYLLAEAELKTQRERVQYLTVRAPFSGVVTMRHLDEGAIVQSGLTDSDAMPLVEIQQVNPLRLTIPMPEADIAGVRVGMGVSVTFPELPGEAIRAKVSRTSRALDPASKTMQVEVDLPNAKGRLKPGMYAKVNMNLGSRSDVLSLPATAQVIFQKSFFLYVVKNGKVERVPLRKGLSNKDFFEVLNPEITAETKVIVQGKSLVKPGQEVEAIFNKNEN